MSRIDLSKARPYCLADETFAWLQSYNNMKMLHYKIIYQLLDLIMVVQV